MGAAAVIAFGDTGNPVREVQRLLVKLGSNIRVDGAYGRRTEGAITRQCSTHSIDRAPRKLHREAFLKLSLAATPASNDDQEFTIHGIDTSGHQRDVDAVEVAGSQSFHIVKATESSTYHHKASAERMEAARTQGTLTGSYHFLRSDKTTAEREAAHYLRHSGYQAGDLPPMADLEKGKSGFHSYNVQHAIDWGQLVQRELGTGKLLLYTTRPSWGAYVYKAGPALLKELASVYDLVWADYVRKGRTISGDLSLTEAHEHSDLERSQKAGLPWKQPVIWQWTGKGSVDGVKGNVDRSLMTQQFFDSYRCAA